MRPPRSGEAVDVDVFEPHPAPGAGPNYDPATRVPENELRGRPARHVVAGGPGRPRGRATVFRRWRAERNEATTSTRPGRGRAVPRRRFRSLLPPPPAERRSAAPARGRRGCRALRRQVAGSLRSEAARGAQGYDEVLLAIGHQGLFRCLPGRATAFARRRRARRHGGEPRLRADIHRCRARADRRARRVVRPLDHP